MNKLFLLAFFSFLVFSCTQNDDAITSEIKTTSEKQISRLSLGENVKLITGKQRNWHTGGGSGSTAISNSEREYTVEVANLNPNKKVTVLQELVDGTWENFDLSYSFTTSVGTEIWKGISNKEKGGFLSHSFGDEFAIKYEVNNQTYWDNNNSNNYHISSDITLGQNTHINVVTDYPTQISDLGGASTIFQVAVDVRNIAYNKEVTVVYSTDNWISNSTMGLGYSHSTNGGELERWIGSIADLDASVQEIQYAVVYKVNGQEYWDNNFGRNYTLVKE